MFIDYLALALLDLVISLSMIVLFFGKYINDNPKKLVPGFLVAGFIGMMLGFHITFTWPLPGSFNIGFGEPLVLFSVLTFGTGLALLFDWDLFSLGVYAFLAGIVAILVGFRLINLGMTKEPVMSGLGFIFTGATGLLYLPAWATRQSPAVRMIAALTALIALVIWAITGYGSYWGHMESFSNWKPATMG